MNFSRSFDLTSHLAASALFMASILLAGKAGAQTSSALAAGIRNFDRDNPATYPAIPKLLSQTGLYRNINLSSRAISDTSVTAFQVNSALWSDGSHKERFISLPPGTKVAPTDTSKFVFPDGAVLIKNFQIDTVHGDKSGNSRIYIETRFLVYQSTPTAKVWSGLSYRWRRDQSDAELVSPDSGMDYTHNVALNGQRVGKRWRYPSTTDCAACHKGDEGDFRGSLGFITPQLNRVVNGTNQLQSLLARGILTANPVANKANAHRWYGLTDTATLEQRVRSYFASNCSHCHGNNVMHGQAQHNFDYFTATKRIAYQPDPMTQQDATGAWLGMPSMSDATLPYLVQSGYPDSSLVLKKMKRRFDDYLSSQNNDQMPPLATNQPDSAAISVLEQWICSLKTGTPCGKLPFESDDTYWGEEVISAAIRPNAKFKMASVQPYMRSGVLNIPFHMVGTGVELRDQRGRSVAIVHEGAGRYRIVQPITPGILILVAGKQKFVLSHFP
jgi:mono/diheme cytochrome c family protein